MKPGDIVVHDGELYFQGGSLSSAIVVGDKAVRFTPKAIGVIIAIEKKPGTKHLRHEVYVLVGDVFGLALDAHHWTVIA